MLNVISYYFSNFVKLYLTNIFLSQVSKISNVILFGLRISSKLVFLISNIFIFHIILVCIDMVINKSGGVLDADEASPTEPSREKLPKFCYPFICTGEGIITCWCCYSVADICYRTRSECQRNC